MIPEMVNFPAGRSRWSRWSVSIAAIVVTLASCGEANSPADEAAAPPGPSTPTADASAADPGIPPSTAVVPTGPPASDTVATPGSVTSTVLTEQGWGPLRVGMTRAEVVTAAGEDANPNAVGGPEPDACDEFRPERAPEGLRVMIERDRLTRITLSTGASVRTERGFGIGDPAEAIRQAYGADAAVSPHKYVPAPAEYITVWATAPGGPDARGLVYEIGPDGRVAHVHAGGPSIQYVEGCL